MKGEEGNKKMIIRQAVQKDLKDIQTLNNQLFDLELKSFDCYLIKGWPLTKEGKEYFEDAIKNDCVFVAEENSNIIGYLLGAKVDIPYYNFEIAEICNMFVKDSFRGKGVGKQLINSFFDYYKNLGISHFTVTASFKNESAKNFYKKMGFEEGNVTFVKF